MQTKYGNRRLPKLGYGW